MFIGVGLFWVAFCSSYRIIRNPIESFINSNLTNLGPYSVYNNKWIPSESSFEKEKRSFQVFAHSYKYVKVTLERDTPHVGNKGEVVTVNRSYAFNYLVPFGFARYTTRSELIGIALNTDYKEALKNVRRSSAVQLKSRIDADLNLNFHIPARAPGSSELNSPIQGIHIITKLRELNYLTPLDLLREEDVKIHSQDGIVTEYGSYKVTLELDKDITTDIKITAIEEPVDTSFLK
ncbi:bifunctional Ribosomal protein L9 [Babesia duncani]|uniref:Bifunctional Ribosomal protein L9 n=1 Tax=Babesia duncani TaxID=323732 RepID=A0AAD9PKP9_9APIC|nr:bifunctional Ribosomal protein L9 [Babesia duncani]